MNLPNLGRRRAFALAGALTLPTSLTGSASPRLTAAASTGNADESGGGVRYPQTEAESAVGALPLDYLQLPYHVLRYGADPTGLRDSTAAFNQAFKAASRAANGYAFGAAGGTFKITGPLLIDVNAVGFDGLGCFLNCASVSKGSIWTPIQSAGDVNRRPLLNAAHPIRHFTMQGPGADNDAAVAVHFNDEKATMNVAGICFESVGFQDWGRDVVFGDGAFCTQFINCSFGITVGNLKKDGPYSISSLSASKNAGERQDFIGCSWYNKRYILDQANGNCDIFLTQCSIDGFVRAINCTGGNVFVSGSHLESPGDTDYWVYAKGGNIFACQIEFVLDADKTKFDLCYSDASNSDFGIYLRDCFPGFGSYTMSTYVVGGGGHCRVDNMPFSKFGSRPPISKALSTLAYGDFQSESFTADWTLTGGTPPSLSAKERHSGKQSLLFSSADGNNSPSAVHRFRCAPGQFFTGELWYFASYFDGTKFTLELQYSDAAGRALSSNTIALGSLGVWTRLQYALPVSAPAGTVEAQIRFSLADVAARAAAAYIDDVVNCVL